MSPDANKSLVREYVETWNRGEIEGLKRFWSPAMIHHTRSQQQTVSEVQRVISEFMTAFPDLWFDIDDIVSEGDRVVTRMTAMATHKGSFLGYPPTGKKINCSVIGIARVADGQFVEHWGVTDELSILAQLGLLPSEYLKAMV
jgi:steroid delta-isomerase-like uncharacterized protein